MATERTRIVTVSDCDEEVRAAVRVVVDAARAGTPLDRIALLHASPEPYARLAHEQLGAAGIPLNGAAIMPLTARVLGRTLLGLLSLPGREFRREDVFTWLAGGHLRHEGHPISVTAWERISREAGVVAGRDDWDRRLTTFAAAQETRALQTDADPDAPPWRADTLRTEATRARALRAFVLALIDDLAAATAQPRPGGNRRPGPGDSFAGWPATSATVRNGLPPSARRRSGSSWPWTGCPRWTRSNPLSASTCSPAPWNSSSTPTSDGSGAWEKACSSVR